MNAHLDDTLTQIAADLKALHMTYDTKVLAAAMLGYTGYLYLLLRTAGTVPAEDIAYMYATIRDRALNDTSVQPTVVKMSGNDRGTLQ